MTAAGDVPETLRLESLAFGGDAVGRDANGRVHFVRLGAPGDLVEVRPRERHTSYTRSELARLVEPGPTRVEPPCARFGACGGCQWQHVAPAAQLAAKAAIVRNALRAVWPAGLAAEPPFASAHGYGYRRRVKLHFLGPIVGLRGARSHDLVDLEECALLAPALGAALGALRRAMAKLPRHLEGEAHCLAGDEGVHVVLACGKNGDALLAGVAEALLADAESRVIGVRTGAALFGCEDVSLAGAAAGEIDERAAGDEFVQAQAEGNRALRETVADFATPAGARVLELYAGGGNLTRALLAAGASAVVAVENGDRAVSRLARLGARVEPVRRDAAAESARRSRAGERFDGALLDPPRTGAAEAVAAVAALAPAWVVYVSCDPMTLARDAARLARSGYALRRVRVLDLMPQTYHVEVVARFEQLGPARQ